MNQAETMNSRYFNASNIGYHYQLCHRCKFSSLYIYHVIFRLYSTASILINETLAVCPICMTESMGFIADARKITYLSLLKSEQEIRCMSLLAGTRCYLAGPIESALDHGAEWRRHLAEKLRAMSINVLDPTDKLVTKLSKNSVGKEGTKELQFVKWLKETQNYDKLTEVMKGIRNADLRLTDIADFIIAYFPRGTNTVGTWEEIFNANRQKKPIFIVWEDGVDNIPSWLWGTLDYRYFFESFDSLLNYLLLLHEGVQKPFDNRWATFDFSSVIEY